MFEDLDAINFKKSGNSIKLMMCNLLIGGQYNFEKIPKLFYDSKIVTVMKNKDDKCFLYCYIRKFHNKPKKHGERISLIDKELVKKIEDETNYNFDNVEIKQLSKIEDLLEINIYLYGCDKNLKNKIPLYKSNKPYEKYLDLLLYENHYMNINRIDLFFNPDSNHKTHFCRSCNNSFYSKTKFDDHILYCQTSKPIILMPSKNKYISFKNIQNTIQSPFVAYCDIESELLYNKENNPYKHKCLLGGYKLHCVDSTKKNLMKLNYVNTVIIDFIKIIMEEK